jgi:hypothetical protein
MKEALALLVTDTVVQFEHMLDMLAPVVLEEFLCLLLFVRQAHELHWQIKCLAA